MTNMFYLYIFNIIFVEVTELLKKDITTGVDDMLYNEDPTLPVTAVYFHFVGHVVNKINCKGLDLTES